MRPVKNMKKTRMKLFRLQAIEFDIFGSETRQKRNKIFHEKYCI